jgi:hypothetical protein
MSGMTIPRWLPAAVFAAALLAAPRAEASTILGSPDATAPPDAFACAMCPPSVDVAFRQFALRGADVEAPEDGVLVSASVYAKRLAGVAAPRIAVLRPDDEDDDGIGVSVADSAPVPVTSAGGETTEVDDLHIPVQAGDSLGLVIPAGQVDLGVRTVRKPDGAVEMFSQPCDPCGSDGGTGTELLFNAVVEPDVDADGLGDETQDPDGGGLGEDWVDDWFDDYDEGDELDEDFATSASPAAKRRLRLLAARRRPGGATLLLRVPRAGQVYASITLPTVRRTGAGPFRTILTGEMHVRHAGRVRLRLRPTPSGERSLARRGHLRTKAVVSLVPRSGRLKVLMHSARL